MTSQKPIGRRKKKACWKLAASYVVDIKYIIVNCTRAGY